MWVGLFNDPVNSDRLNVPVNKPIQLDPDKKLIDRKVRAISFPIIQESTTAAFMKTNLFAPQYHVGARPDPNQQNYYVDGVNLPYFFVTLYDTKGTLRVKDMPLSYLVESTETLIDESVHRQILKVFDFDIDLAKSFVYSTHKMEDGGGNIDYQYLLMYAHHIK